MDRLGAGRILGRKSVNCQLEKLFQTYSFRQGSLPSLETYLANFRKSIHLRLWAGSPA